MAGDHKCPVCQSTFTRPQHVARHMRSHTGDRPYKCQHCGDAFARSDLLSRHVNKCHSAEKAAAVAAGLIPPPGTKRGKGRTSGKAPCDQCIIADGTGGRGGCNSGEPCTKCVTKGIKCTYSQIPLTKQGTMVHQASQPLPSLTLTQTHPSPRLPRTSLESTSSSASSVASYPGNVDYTFRNTPIVPSSPNPPVNTGDAIFGNIPQSFNFSTASHPSANLFSPDSPTTALDLHHPHQQSAQSSPVHGSQYTLYDNILPGPPPPGSRDGLYYSNNRYVPRSMYSTSGGTGDASASSSPDHHHARLGQLHQPQPTYYLPPNDGRPQTAGEGGFSSAFGLMSLDDPNVLAGLASHAPFFDNSDKDSRFRYTVPDPATSEQSPYSGGESHPQPHDQQQQGNDVRALWNSFMRTPSDHNGLRKKNSDGYIGTSYTNHSATNDWGSIGLGEYGTNGNDTANHHGIEKPGMGSRRWSHRRASLPPTKTPPARMDDSLYSMSRSTYSQQGPQQPPPQVGNISRPDELRMYEAAVLSRPLQEFKVDPSHIVNVKRSRTLGHESSHSRGSQQQQHQQQQPQRMVLPMGRNAPFIGPPGPPPASASQAHNQNLSGSESSRTGSPVRPSSSSQMSSQQQQQQQQPNSSPRTSQLTHSAPQPPAPGSWETINLSVPRPVPKRNASQTLEQELQKSLRPSVASDVTSTTSPTTSSGNTSRPGTGHGNYLPHPQAHHHNVNVNVNPYGGHGHHLNHHPHHPHVPSSRMPSQGLGQYVGDTLA